MDEYNNTKIVEFDEYCHKCKYELRNEEDEPCFDCLQIPAREYSHKPEYFEEK